jgi:hypothetical protein
MNAPDPKRRHTAATLLGVAVWLARRGPLPLRLVAAAVVLLRWQRRRRAVHGSGADPRAAHYAVRDQTIADVEEAPHGTAGGRRHRTDR